jgi:MFS superfamily sulfate permease-like transporter
MCYRIKKYISEHIIEIISLHLLQGIGPRVLWIGIGGSIFFGVLESTKRVLAERRPKLALRSNPEKRQD